MPVKSFKFVSPGVFINEIDNSQLPAVPDEIGPVVIGRTEKGPAMRPVQVSSFSEFIETFGNPLPGGQGGDIWRDGNYTAPTYAAYAAQAYLRNSNACTVVRLLGAQSGEVADGGSGEAGWRTSLANGNESSNDTSMATNGGAYGLFVFPSSSVTTHVSGALAAVWYLNRGSIVLSGTTRDGVTAVTGSAILLKSSTAAGAGGNEYVAVITDENNSVVKRTAFNFEPASAKYIRKVFNTNPTLVNTNTTRTANQQIYWLGQSYERFALNLASGSAGEQVGAIMGLDSGSTSYANMRQGFQAAQTPWLIGQDLQSDSADFDVENDTDKLFKFHTLDAGEREQATLKISIKDIKVSTNEFDPYGSFTVLVRSARDSDNVPVILEQFSAVNLNPNSPRYIARVIGDQNLQWDDVKRYHRIHGTYPNASKYIRVEMDPQVDIGDMDARLLPFGSYGPLRPLSVGGLLDSADARTYLSGGSAPNSAWVGGGGSIPKANADLLGNQFLDVRGPANLGASPIRFTGSFHFPSVPLRRDATDGDLADATEAYFGADTTRKNSTKHEESYADLVRMLPSNLDSFSKAANTEYSYIFTLDDLALSGSGGTATWISGSRANGQSATAVSGTYTEILDSGYDRFTVPLYGGFDGLDITEKEPFNNTRMGTSDTTSYSYYSARRAIDTVADPERVEYNLMAMPGIYKEPITSHMIEVCESRGDALAVVDLDTGYRADTENTNSLGDNLGSVSNAVTNLRNRKINSSYGCAYYPWVQIRDSISDSFVWMPPSVVALGTFSSAARKSELWFAPAGFTRGGLTEGSAGLPVLQVRERLRSKDRDELYEASINPIATFPAEGIVIFGQKTLQVTPSALDRINVRRLMIYTKKEISRIAARLLFDQNVESTWNRFLNKVNPFLNSIQARLGLTDYKVVLDSRTTTAELVDRNIMYARIYLKPARAIEFIALDFVITNTGASFED